MDAFSGYNQIKMDEGDQEKTSFITSQGLFCYKVMPFGLKNAGATYQRSPEAHPDAFPHPSFSSSYHLHILLHFVQSVDETYG